ncbi:hypothetical protein FKP32DRAFT_479092 [Trametes sanguinea]|nr:hypothetical protein FKP32DRAFT_479092 [Trametes sanguinea]
MTPPVVSASCPARGLCGALATSPLLCRLHRESRIHCPLPQDAPLWPVAPMVGPWISCAISLRGAFLPTAPDSEPIGMRMCSERHVHGFEHPYACIAEDE